MTGRTLQPRFVLPGSLIVNVVQDTHEGANVLENASGKPMVVSSSISGSIAQQDDATSEVAATREEITVSIFHVSDNAQVANDLAKSASAVSDNGRSAVSQAESEMQIFADSERTSASETIARSVERVARMIADNTVAVRSVGADARHLNEFAHKLKASVGRFRIT